jgi:hypothetical protein
MSVDRTVPVKPRRRPRGPSDRNVRQRTGLVLTVVGILLFLASSIGARAGFVVLPFDPHHVVGQLAGPVIALLGASLMRRER